MRVVITDGGRSAAGFRGAAGDCVTRAIAIAAELDYRTVYTDLNALTQPMRVRGKRSSARDGVPKTVIRKYLGQIGWSWTPTMGIGTGCRTHLDERDLPLGRLIVSVSRHLVAVIDHVIYDTHDPQRGDTFCFDAQGRYVRLGGGRCVYGYWTKVA
jgi:hypothetical protein